MKERHPLFHMRERVVIQRRAVQQLLVGDWVRNTRT